MGLFTSSYDHNAPPCICGEQHTGWFDAGFDCPKQKSGEGEKHGPDRKNYHDNGKLRQEAATEHDFIG